MFCDKVVKLVEVSLFLLEHVLHQWPQFWMRLDNRRGLREIDEDSGELACLVYTQLRWWSARPAVSKSAAKQRTALSRKPFCSSLSGVRGLPGEREGDSIALLSAGATAAAAEDAHRLSPLDRMTADAKHLEAEKSCGRSVRAARATRGGNMADMVKL